MPKEAKSKDLWVKDLQKIANGGLFERGQAPKPGTWAAAEVVKIRSCPAMGSNNTSLISNETRTCQCTYHLPKPLAQSTQLPKASVLKVSFKSNQQKENALDPRPN